VWRDFRDSRTVQPRAARRSVLAGALPECGVRIYAKSLIRPAHSAARCVTICLHARGGFDCGDTCAVHNLMRVRDCRGGLRFGLPNRRARTRMRAQYALRSEYRLQPVPANRALSRIVSTTLCSRGRIFRPDGSPTRLRQMVLLEHHTSRARAASRLPRGAQR
jgi:hypothetical protein